MNEFSYWLVSSLKAGVRTFTSLYQLSNGLIRHVASTLIEACCNELAWIANQHSQLLKGRHFLKTTRAGLGRKDSHSDWILTTFGCYFPLAFLLSLRRHNGVIQIHFSPMHRADFAPFLAWLGLWPPKIWRSDGNKDQPTSSTPSPQSRLRREGPCCWLILGLSLFRLESRE